MKFIITTIGTAGDVYPFIGLAQELKRRGHTVYFLTCETYRPHIEKQGIHFHAVLSKTEYEKAINSRNFNRILTNVSIFSRHFILPTLKPTYEFIKAHYQEGETVLITHVMFLASRIMHDKFDIPLVTVHLAPIGLLSIDHPQRYPGITFPPVLPYWVKSTLFKLWMPILDRLLSVSKINQFRASLKLPPVKRIFNGWVQSPQKIIGLFPSWFGIQQKDLPKPLEVTGFPLYNPNGVTELPEPLSDFLGRGRKTIIFTAGSGMKFAHRFYKESIAACNALGYDGILLTRYPEQIPNPLPSNIYHLDYLPLRLLLPHISAIVHFGGIGTAAQALSQGVPQLLVPNIGDQFDNALRLRQCGVALELRQRHYYSKHIVKKLTTLLTSSQIQKNCQRYADLMENDEGIHNACDALIRSL